MNQSLHSLLVATDLSAPARHAADRAARIAHITGARLCLAHVANLSPLAQFGQWLSLDAERFAGTLLEQARVQLQAQVEHFSQHYDLAPDLALSSGKLLDELEALSRDRQAEVIVLGARGASFMRHLLLGSTAERMLGTLHTSMLVVKQPAHEPYRRVLVPVDFSPHSLPAVQLARKLAPTAELVLLHAFELPFEGQLRYAGVEENTLEHYRMVELQEANQALRRLCLAAGQPLSHTELRVEHGNPSQKIIELEQTEDCDLIVLGKQGQSGLHDFLLGSTTRHVLSEGQGDVLVVVPAAG